MKLQKKKDLKIITNELENFRKDPNRITIDDLPLNIKIVKFCEDSNAYVKYSQTK